MYYNNRYPSKVKGQNSVRGAKLGLYKVLGIGAIMGIILYIVLGLLVDLLLFGTITPCKTAYKYEDGSSIQVCEVRN